MSGRAPKERIPIAVDFDGVIAQYHKWEGIFKTEPPIEGAREFLQQLRDNDYYIYIYSSRTNPDNVPRYGTIYTAAKVIEQYMKDNDLPFDAVWTKAGKPNVKVFVDDRAVTCRPQFYTKAYEIALMMIQDIVASGTKPQVSD